MRHKLIIFSEVVLVAAAIAAAFFIIKHPDRHDDKISVNTQPAPRAAQACKLYTLTDAKRLLGQQAKPSTNPIYDSNGSNLYTSSCTYTEESPPGQQPEIKQSSTLTVRRPQTDKGIQSNQGEFGPLKPVDSQVVDGYGDSAFWDPTHGELNVLRTNTWYEFSIGPSTPADRTLDQAKRMADLLLPSL
jgi:hypothetical protein